MVDQTIPGWLIENKTLDFSDTAIVALDCSGMSAVAAQFPDTGEAVPADERHVTLLFLGEIGKLDREFALSAVAGVAKRFAPIEGVFNGVAVFDNGNEKALVALYDSPGLGELNAALAEAFGDRIAAPTHGFTPHMTLAYLDGGLTLPDINLNARAGFGEISLYWGREHISFKLTGGQREKGGPGSGFFGHAGRPGKRGGSAPAKGGMSAGVEDGVLRLRNKQDELDRIRYASKNLSREALWELLLLLEDERTNAFIDDDARVGDRPIYNSNVPHDWYTAPTRTRALIKEMIVNRLVEMSGVESGVVDKIIAQWAQAANARSGISGIDSMRIQEAISEEFGVDLSPFQRQLQDRIVDYATANRGFVEEKLKEMMARVADIRAEQHTGTANEMRERLNFAIWSAVGQIKYGVTIASMMVDLVSQWLDTNPLETEVPAELIDKISGLSQDPPIADRPTIRRVVRAMYEHTQSVFRQRGFGPDDELVLFRGVTLNENLGITKNKIGGSLDFIMNAAESWSSSATMAEDFGSVAVGARIKVKNILATCLTGFGCLTEGEFVVLGGGSATVTVINATIGDLPVESTKGGPGSGFYGHAGRPGKRGGSQPDKGGEVGTGDTATNLPGVTVNPDNYHRPISGLVIGDYYAGRQPDFVKYDFPEDERELEGVLTKRRGVIKNEIVTRLAEETGLDYGEVNGIIADWRGSATNNVLSVAVIHHVIAQEFGLPETDLHRFYAEAGNEGSNAGRAFSEVRTLYERYMEDSESVASHFGREMDNAPERGNRYEEMLAQTEILRRQDAQLGVVRQRYLDAVQAVASKYGYSPEIVAGVAQEWAYIPPVSPERIEKIRKVVRQMYADTQREMKERFGLGPEDSVILFRGVDVSGIRLEGNNLVPFQIAVQFAGRRGMRVKISGNSAESWTASTDVAKDFGTVLACRVKVKNILCTSRTGFGASDLSEFVVMGHSSGYTAQVIRMEMLDYQRLMGQTAEKGGPGSGFFRHAGRPGKRGGSAPANFGASGNVPTHFGVRQYFHEMGGYTGDEIDRMTFGLDRLNQRHLRIINDRVPAPTDSDLDEIDIERDEYMQAPPFTRKWAYSSDWLRGEVKNRIVSELADETGLEYDEVNAIIAGWRGSLGSKAQLAVIHHAISEEFGQPLDEAHRESYDESVFYRAAKRAYDRYEVEVKLLKDRPGDQGGIAEDVVADIEKEYRASLAGTRFEDEKARIPGGFAPGNDAFMAYVGMKHNLYPKAISLPEDFPDEGKIRRVVRAMYERTQAFLAENGYGPEDEITLFRGVSTGAGSAQRRFVVSDGSWGTTARYRGSVAESWTLSSRVALEYALGREGERLGALIGQRVKVKNILATCLTGFGALNLAEFTVMGNSRETTVQAIFGGFHTWFDEYEANHPDIERERAYKGGNGSGNFGHAGRPGKRGGSAPSNRVASGKIQFEPNVMPSTRRYVGQYERIENTSALERTPRYALWITPDEKLIRLTGENDTDDHIMVVVANPELWDEFGLESADFFDENSPDYYPELALYEKALENGAIRVRYANRVAFIQTASMDAATLRRMQRLVGEHKLALKPGDFVVWDASLRRGGQSIEYVEGAFEDFMAADRLVRGENGITLKGGPGSGNFGHAGRPGEVGGSAPAKGGVSAGITAKPLSEQFTGVDLLRHFYGDELLNRDVTPYGEHEWEIIGRMARKVSEYLDAVGLTLTEDQMNVYNKLHDRIAADIGVEPDKLWSTDEGTSLMRFDSELRDQYEWRIRRAISRGEITPERGSELMHSAGRTQGGPWENLPPTLYHATTSVDGIVASGIKSRVELHMANGGIGLGGGESDTISFGESEDACINIERSLHAAWQVATGRVTVRDMVEMAKGGALGVGRSFFSEFEKSLRSLQGPSSEMIEIDEGRRLDRWHDNQPYTQEEILRNRARVLNALMWAAQAAGGFENPLFMFNDWDAFARLNPRDFGTLRFRPKRGARGYRMGALSEWRTVAGDAVELAEVVRHFDPDTDFDKIWGIQA